MSKIFIVFTFLIITVSIMLGGLSGIVIKSSSLTETQTTHHLITQNQHECGNKNCQNVCDISNCDCIHHACTGTIGFLNLANNHIASLFAHDDFPSILSYKQNNIHYPISHPPRA